MNSWIQRRVTSLVLALAVVVMPLVGRAQQVAAGDGGSDVARTTDDLLARRVSVRLDGVSLERAIDAVAAQARVLVSYNQEVIDAYKTPVTIHANGVPLGAVFERVLAGTKLRVIGMPGSRLAVIDGGRIPPVLRQVQPTGRITGRVVDSASGHGVRGVSVRVQGRRIPIAITTDDGAFVLQDVPTGEHVLVVRLLGYRSVNRPVTVPDSGDAYVQVTLAPAPTVLSGVVTTATGTQRKLEVGSDIATLNVDSIMKVAPITSVTDLLEARVPGVTVQRTSGTPGAPARIRLRGVGSLTRNNDPIVIVDGVRVYAQQSDVRNHNDLSRPVASSGGRVSNGYAAPSPLDQIDPNSIETLEVLRGSSASAMYGSDAGNGVIVITTKRGRAGPTHVSATLGQGASFQPGSFPVGLYRFGHSYNGPTRFCALSDPLCIVDSVVAFQALNDPMFAVTTAHGRTQDLSGLISGGVGTLTYALTGSYAHTTGQLQLPTIEVERFTTFHGFAPPSWMRRPDQYTTSGGGSRLDLPLSAGGRVGTASLTSSVFKSDQQQSSLQTAISQLLGTYIDTTQLGATTILPEFYERATNGSMNVTNAVTLTWPVASWLPLTATAGANLMNTTQQTLTPRDYVLTTADSAGHFGVNRGSTAQYTLNVNTTMPSRWAHTAVGFNFTNSATNDISASVTGLPLGVTNPTSFTGLVSGQNAGESSQSSVATSTYGWFVAPTLNLRSRLFATPGLRLDGGSASGGRVSTSVGGQSIRGVSGFPKMDVSWLAVDPSGERTRHGVFSAVSLLRLRGAFGTAGRQPDPANQLRLFTSARVIPAIGVQAGQDIVELSALGNTVLRPERSRELEYGLDAELWQGRVALGLTGARKATQDALLGVTLAPSVVGQVSDIDQLTTIVQRNIGATRNTDLEVTARATVLQRAAVLWDVGGTLTRSSSVVVRLDPSIDELVVGQNAASGTTNRIVAGYPINGVWARPIMGYGDANGDGIIQSTEVLVGDSARYLGQPLPTYEASVNTNLALFNGRLTAHTALAYQHGMTQVNAAGAQTGNVCPNGVNSCYAAGTVLFGNDPAAPLGQQAAFAALARGDGNQRTAYGLVQTVNVLRWQSLSVNYVAPQAMARLVRARQLTVALQGNNLGLHTNYHGKDPNVNAYSYGDQVTDAGQLPLPRTFMLKLTLGN